VHSFVSSAGYSRITYRDQGIFVSGDRPPCRSLEGPAGTPAPTEKPASLDIGNETVLENWDAKAFPSQTRRHIIQSDHFTLFISFDLMAVD
jgi:hypothetical protein